MASNRDPRKSYRTNRRGRRVTTSATRSKRSKQSTAPKPTSSSTRSTQKGKSTKVTTGRGQTRTPPRGAQGPRTPPVQGPSRRVTGIIGTRNGSTSKPSSSPPTPGTKFRAKNVVKPSRLTPRGGGSRSGSGIKTTLLAGMATALATGALRNPISKAKQREAKEKLQKSASSVGKYNTRDNDGTVRSRAKVGPKKVGPKKVGTAAQSFDKAFSAARKAGKKEFTWKGKKYNTKTK